MIGYVNEGVIKNDHHSTAHTLAHHHYLLKQWIGGIQITPHNSLSHCINPLNQFRSVRRLHMQDFFCSNEFEGVHAEVGFEHTAVGGNDVFADDAGVGFVFRFTDDG